MIYFISEDIKDEKFITNQLDYSINQMIII